MLVMMVGRKLKDENDILLLVRKSIEKPDEISEGDYLRLGKYLDLVMNAQLAQATMQVEGGLVVGEVEDVDEKTSLSCPDLRIASSNCSVPDTLFS